MKPPPFKYYSPQSVEEVLSLLDEYGDEAKLLAGGQSLVPAMNFRLLQPAILIDINPVSELSGIERQNGDLIVGAMSRLRDLEYEKIVREAAPLIHETMPFVAHSQIRNRGTVGGSMAHADPAAELPVLAVALSARFRALSSAGERWLETKDFFKGMFFTDLAANELLTQIAFPSLPENTGWAFTEFSRRRGDYALMGLAVTLSVDKNGKCQAARLVYLNAGDGPVEAGSAAEALVGEQLNEEVFTAAARQARDEIEPMGNVHTSADFQRHLADVLTRRALGTAYERAGPRNK